MKTNNQNKTEKHPGMLGVECFICEASPSLEQAVLLLFHEVKPEDIICDKCREISEQKQKKRSKKN